MSNEMHRIDAYLPDDLEQHFREAVFKRFGMKKGNISEALKEAVELWIKKVESEVQTPKIRVRGK